jgi:REP element-mobilizing transposase RayT
MDIGRKKLDHTVPDGASTNPEFEVFFITICCEERGVNVLARPEVWHRMVEAMDHFEQSGNLKVRLALAMPDHFHALWMFPGERSMAQVVSSFKRWLARQSGIRWQRGFFDHRIRSWESAQEKRRYIRMNPLRAGLVEHEEAWAFQKDGRI